MSSARTEKEEGEARARALGQEYTETHPNGPYPQAELMRKEKP